jgi:hypothetical protein
LPGRGKEKSVLTCVSRKTFGVVLKAGFMAEESGVKAFQKQNQVLHGVQDDRVVSF